MIDYPAILVRRYKGKEWLLNGEEYSGLVWLSDSPKPSKSKLDSLWSSVQEEIAAEKAAKESSKNAALAKLEALGLTPDDIKAILD